MPIEFKDFITRNEVREHNKTHIYVFGDNLKHKGFGGQAKQMRGELNTIGIPTKKSPYKYFTDEDYENVISIIESEFDMINMYSKAGFTVVIPKAGIGTGRAKLAEEAPKIWKLIKENLKRLGWKNDTNQ